MIVGEKFGFLTVIDFHHKHGNHIYWNCICECGNNKVMGWDSLKKNKSISCGCKIVRYDNFIDKTGEKFGRITILSLHHKSNYIVFWNCKCDCGNECILRGYDLTNGKTKSCGCISMELKGSNHPKYKGNRNIYEMVRRSHGYIDWRLSVYKRDNFTCQKCSDSTGGNLNAHHIINFSDIYNNSDLLYNVNNGITLCKPCHVKFHNIYGRSNNSVEQLGRFLDYV